MDILVTKPAAGKTTKALMRLLTDTNNYLIVPTSQAYWYRSNFPVVKDRIFTMTEVAQRRCFKFKRAIINNAETVLQEILSSAAPGSIIELLTIENEVPIEWSGENFPVLEEDFCPACTGTGTIPTIHFSMFDDEDSVVEEICHVCGGPDNDIPKELSEELKEVPITDE